jgi:uncharacterized protein (TIGR02246 family)
MIAPGKENTAAIQPDLPVLNRRRFMRLILLISISFLLAAAASATDGLNSTGAAFVKAFEANDLEAVVALYAPDAHLYPPDSVEAAGKDKIREVYGMMMKNFTIQQMKMIDAHYQTIGDLSFAWGRFLLVMVSKPGGEQVKMEGRFTDVSKKIGGKWLYMIDHASVPFAPPPATPDK